MKVEDQIKQARYYMETPIKVTKQVYKAIDSYERRQRWVGRNLVKFIKEQYGLAKTI